MSTVRAKQREQAAEAKKLKKVVKPVLSSPFSLQWPDLSDNAKTQVEAALTKVLMPLVDARFNVYNKPKDVSDLNNDDTPVDEEPEAPVASTSALPAAEPDAKSTHPHPKWTKRQVRLAKRMSRLERTPGVQIPAGSHDVQLRSGKLITVPNHAIPEKFFPSMLLNKSTALDARPAICNNLVIGVNAVTRALEEEIEDARRGLIGRPAASREQERVQDSLRCFIPAPNFSTRKQRREVRNALHRDEGLAKSKKRKVMEEIVKANQGAMPDTITSIPRGDVVLILTLEEIRADLANAPPDGGPDASEVIRSIIQHIKGDIGEATQADMSVDADPTPQSPTISIPTMLISKLVGEASMIDSQSRSILTSLLMRHDPSWFASQNKLESVQLLQREAQFEAADAAAAGKRKKGIHRVEGSSRGQPITVDTASTAAKSQNGANLPFLSPKELISLVFVAKDDINPLDIVSHILTAVTARNSINTALRRRNVRLLNKGKARDKDKPEEGKDNTGSLQLEDIPIPDILLVPLAKGAEARLAELLGIRRVSVLALTNNSMAEFDQLRRLVESHLPEAPHADWLVPSSNYLPPFEDAQADVPGRHLLTTIKHLQTHAPADLKAAKVAKKEAKQARKEGPSAGVQNGIEEPLIATQL